MNVLLMIILGLSAGSFANAVVWRVHAQAKAKKPNKSLSITKGRSMCPHCRHVLAWYDLIPVISWVSLMGKCRYCHRPISLQYPLVELITTALFMWSYLEWVPLGKWADPVALGLWLVTLTGLVVLFIYDLRWMLLPNRILYPLFIPAGLYAATVVFTSNKPVEKVVAHILAAFFLGGLFWLLFQVSKGRWIGGGDVKLGFLLGLLAGGLAQAILLLFLASLIGTLVALPMMVAKKARTNTRLAFGPFLIVASFVVILYGSSIIGWYNQLFLTY